MHKTNSKQKLKKTPQYREGVEAKKNFERMMKGLFRVPKTDSKKGKD